MLVYLRDGSAQTAGRAVTPRIKVADGTFYLTHSLCADTGPSSPTTNPVAPGAWQSSLWRVPILKSLHLEKRSTGVPILKSLHLGKKTHWSTNS